ncbi:MAG: YybH family protein [Burkholderiales bacterium]
MDGGRRGIPALRTPPIRGKAEFLAAQGGLNQYKLESQSEVREIRVLGDWAYSWNKLALTLTPSDGGAPMKRSGHILSVLRKQAGKWVIYRDANMLTTGKST